MTTEEKAKRYDEISKEVKDFFDGKQKMYSDVEQTLNYLFPELGESEDERIRKELIDYINRLTATPNNIDRYNSWIAWLEKQGEMSKLLEDKDKLIKELGKYKVKYTQETLEKALTTNNIDDERLRKNTIAFLKDWLEKQGEKEEPQVYDTGDGDIITYSETDGYKVEPKLKIERGKWYVCIKNLLDDYGNIAFCKGDVYLSEKDEYLIPCNSNVPCMIAYCVDTYFREWTIQDAKDGDVLSNGKMIVIFKHFEDPSYRQHIVAHIGLDTIGDIQITDDTWKLGIDKAKPATKEERNLLFSKMKEEGYEWDADKKELKKINSYCQENCKGYQETSKCFADGGCDAKRKAEQKSTTWSEEDEEILKNLIDYFSLDDGLRLPTEETIDWLKSLKERLL